MPVEIAGQADVVPPQRRDIPEEVRIGQSTLPPQVIDGLVHVAGVPVDDGGDDEIQGHDASLLSGVGAVMDSSLRMREDSLGQGMARLALAEARLARHTQLEAFDPLQHEQCAFDASDLAEGEVQAVLLPVGAQLPEHGRGLDGLGLDTGCQSHHVAPVIEDDRLMDRSSHDGSKALELAGFAEAGQTTIREVPQPGREHEAQEVEQREDVIRDPAGINIVHQRIELGGVSHEPVQDERRLACGGADDVGMERAILPRQERIDLESRIWTVLGVNFP